jgi:hypothetical protein
MRRSVSCMLAGLWICLPVWIFAADPESLKHLQLGGALTLLWQQAIGYWWLYHVMFDGALQSSAE